MKKLILFVLLIVTTMMNVVAQNRNINFEQTKEWKKIIKKAKKENKLLILRQRKIIFFGASCDF